MHNRLVRRCGRSGRRWYTRCGRGLLWGSAPAGRCVSLDSPARGVVYTAVVPGRGTLFLPRAARRPVIIAVLVLTAVLASTLVAVFLASWGGRRSLVRRWHGRQGAPSFRRGQAERSGPRRQRARGIKADPRHARLRLEVRPGRRVASLVGLPPCGGRHLAEDRDDPSRRRREAQDPPSAAPLAPRRNRRSSRGRGSRSGRLPARAARGFSRRGLRDTFQRTVPTGGRSCPIARK